MTESSSTRIAKNTFFLYIRNIISIVINLVTVKLLWKALGIDNYGIYNVVGGIVLMFAFLNNAMVASSQRFISFELGRGNPERLRKTFTISVTVHTILATLVLILAETIGLWFMNAKLNIPEGSMFAANVVYQCSILSFIVGMLSVPYNATIVAHEHMKVFGYYGVLEVVLKLVAVLVVCMFDHNRLIIYAVGVLVVTVIMRVIYGLYCRRHFEECRLVKEKDPQLMRDMFSFAGWSFVGNLGFSVRDQGINILLNMFFNVAVNAAKGIANQIGNVIYGFAGSFSMALTPQITKNYAAGNMSEMVKLIYAGCKYAMLLLSILVIPIAIAAEDILHLWLGDVAPYTVEFMRLVLLLALIESVLSPIVTALQATGNLRTFQIVISIIMMLNLPVSWVALKLYHDPLSVMYVSCTMSSIGIVARLMILHSLVPISYREFLLKVYLRTLPMIVLGGWCSWLLFKITMGGVIGLILFAAESVAIILLMSYLIVLTKKEKQMVVGKIRRSLHIGVK